MIENCSFFFIPQVQELLSKNPLQNPYLYIDINTYGSQGDNIRTYLVRSNEQIQIIIYQYYNSLQLWMNKNVTIDGSALKELAQFITQYRFVMVSGLTSLITGLKAHLDIYQQVDGHLFKFKGQIEQHTTDLPVFQWAHTPQEFERLASFITTDADIGSHYTITQLTQQFLERHEKYGCQNVFLEQEGQVIAHLGTYACYKQLAVIGGLLVDSNQRGKGLGRQIMMFLSKQCEDRFGQQTVLYCYNPSLFKFYNTCGYEQIYDCSKLELRGDQHA